MEKRQKRVTANRNRVLYCLGCKTVINYFGPDMNSPVLKDKVWDACLAVYGKVEDGCGRYFLCEDCMAKALGKGSITVDDLKKVPMSRWWLEHKIKKGTEVPLF